MGVPRSKESHYRRGSEEDGEGGGDISRRRNGQPHPVDNLGVGREEVGKSPATGRYGQQGPAPSQGSPVAGRRLGGSKNRHEGGGHGGEASGGVSSVFA